MRNGRQRSRWRVSRSFLLAVAMTVSGKIAVPAVAQSPPALSRSSVPATGRQESLLTVSKFGRYAITASSPQGTALQLLDRIAGPGEIHGVAGKTDGRLDVFLDRGTHKIVTYAHAKGSGTARLAVHPFTERHAPQPPLLVELKPVDGTLDDFEQQSYWVEVKERRPVLFEAAGRNLTDLRLWNNGDWLLDAAPHTEVVSPEPGHPLLICRLAATLDPGFYLLTAYGGTGQPWAEDNGSHPFHLRFGIPKLGAVGRARHTVSVFGLDRWLVPASATYFRIELAEARPAALRVARFSQQDPFSAYGSEARVEKNSLLPVAEVEVGTEYRDDDLRLVTVTGAAGQPYMLQHFDRGEPAFCGGRSWRLGVEGRYWVSTVHSGDASDSVDATALIIRIPRWRPTDPHIEPAATQVVELPSGASWARRCNLLEPLTLFVHVHSAGKYEILSRGTEAKFRIEPFLIYRPEHYEPPELRGAGSVWDLEAGSYYVLTAQPEKKGIIDLALRPAGQTNATDVFAEHIGKDRAAELLSLRAAAQFPALVIDHDYQYTIFINQQPEVKVGMVLRPLPLDLTDPLPVIQKPGEQVSVPFRVAAPSVLRAEADDGSLVPVSVDGATPQKSQTVTTGEHHLDVRDVGGRQVHYALLVAPLQLQASTPLPPLPDPARAAPPKLEVLTAKQPRFFDLDRNADATFLLRADAPALYRLQSTGLLDTEGKLRTRTITAFDHALSNGVGHNFFIQQYLREGDYQITVSTLGRTKGHLGLTLERTQLVDGGALTPGIAAHVALPAGEAVGYTFAVAEAGDYRVRSMGVGTTFRMRVEDADGWPIEPPNITADLTRHFDPGTYRIVSLPEPVAARRITLLERIVDAPQRTGHGPHTLPLATRVEHEWLEPADGAARLPDTWELTVPAPVDVTIDLTNEMEGTLVLVGADAGRTPVATLLPARGWKGKLAMGRYRLEVACARPDNRHGYQIAVWPEQLVAGLERDVTAPTSVPLSVGSDGLIQLSSFGPTDVRARLYDAQERLVASNDDGPDDWNFQIQARVPAGTYRLQVDPVVLESPKLLAPPPTPTYGYYRRRRRSEEGTEESPSGATPARSVVSMRAPHESEQAPIGVPAHISATLGDGVQIYPLTIAADAGLLLLAAQAPEGVGLALEATAPGDDASWRTLGTVAGRVARLEIPLRSAAWRYRLRLWSIDRRATTAQLTVATVRSQAVTERQLREGVAAGAVTDLEPRTGVVAVQLDGSGVFRLDGESGAVRACAVADAPCAEAVNGVVAASQSLLWFAVDLAAAQTRRTVTATRINLASGSGDTGLQFDVAAARRVVCDVSNDHRGPLLVTATSDSGQPGVALVDRSEIGHAGVGYENLAVGPGSAVAVKLVSSRPAALVWSASSLSDFAAHSDPTGSGPAERTPPAGPSAGEPIAVRLQALSFAPPAHAQAAWGSWDAALSGVTAQAFDLPPGPKRMRLALRAGTVAVLSDGDHVSSVHWRGDAPFEETVDGSADRLTVLHTRTEADELHVELLPLDPAGIVAPLAVAAPYERAQLRAGVLRLGVAPAEPDALHPRTLHVRTVEDSSRDTPALLGSDGRIVRGRDLALGDGGGTLWVPHGAGLVLAWIDRRGEEAQDLWGAAPLAVQTNLEAAALVALTGTVQALRFTPPEPLMLHVRSATPAVTLLKRGAGPPEVEVHATGTVLDAYLGAEETVLGLRAIGGGALSGTAEVTTSPVTPIGEGLGPEVLLAAGATRLFSFVVKQDGPVGIGVRANPDVVDCALLDASGKRLGSGVVQMPTLGAGTYLLALHAPPSTGPVTARPALAGIALPSTAPPQDVVRNYMKLATTPPPEPTAARDDAD
jgi:hypothetical protein